MTLDVSHQDVKSLWDCGKARRAIVAAADAAALSEYNIDVYKYEFREYYYSGGDFGCWGGGMGWVGCGHPSRQPYPGGCSVYNYGFSTRLSHHEIGHNLGVCALWSSHPLALARCPHALLPRTRIAQITASCDGSRAVAALDLPFRRVRRRDRRNGFRQDLHAWASLQPRLAARFSNCQMGFAASSRRELLEQVRRCRLLRLVRSRQRVLQEGRQQRAW